MSVVMDKGLEWGLYTLFMGGSDELKVLSAEVCMYSDGCGYARKIIVSILAKHIDDGNWMSLFEREQITHVVTFSYNLIKWIERDRADTLELRSTEFVWSKNQTTMGKFPISVSEPEPSFLETLLEVFDKDEVVQKHLGVRYEGHGKFTFRRNK